ncbi:MAG: hypothetical protein JOZ88_19895 [Hyphomicrobiales bacterium]|nr:hypothetical protein [Hyphomicrobiales bacterium]
MFAALLPLADIVVGVAPSPSAHLPPARAKGARLFERSQRGVVGLDGRVSAADRSLHQIIA